ncbi:MAG: cysteine desulfurase family protein [Desulfobacca sp.]|nr:cysteine desulfurase family protein [Desulfobacca sp.]
MIYLDYNATTPIAPEVAAGIKKYIVEEFGNPSSAYALGQRAHTAIAQARQQVANLLGCQPQELVFLSCASEANNTVIKGVAHHLQARGNHLITTQIEHPAVLNPCLFLLEQGFDISFVPVDGRGQVDPDDIRRELTAKTVLISVMHANNETGAIQPLAEIGTLAREAGVWFHSDAAQSVGKIPTRMDELGVDFLTLAGHKFYAPKGIGALYVRTGCGFTPLIHGGGQEAGRRSGTENVIFDVALGLAAELAQDRLAQDQIHLKALRDRLHQRLQEFFPALVLNGPEQDRLPNTLNVSFPGLSGAEILAALPDLAASTGAACHGPEVKLSHVLAAMGISRAVGRGAVRFSVGRYTTETEIDQAAAMIGRCLQKLR